MQNISKGVSLFSLLTIVFDKFIAGVVYKM